MPFAFLAPALAGLLIFRVTPIGISLVGGLFGTSLTGDTVFRGLSNYATLVQDGEFWNSVRVTLLFNTVINPLQVAIARNTNLQITNWGGLFASASVSVLVAALPFLALQRTYIRAIMYSGFK